MPQRIADGMGQHHFQHQPPKQPEPVKGCLGRHPVTPETGQRYVNANTARAVNGKTQRHLLQRNAHSNAALYLQQAAPVTFQGATIDKEYNYPIVPKKDLLKVRKLGKGTYGSVVLVIHRYTHQYLALKMVGNDTDRRQECAQLIRIQRAIAKIHGNTENIVNLISLSRGRSDRKYVLMEYGGRDLLGSSKKYGRFRGNELKKTFFQAVKGVNTLFRAGYQHHDIKPANILISRKGVVKICDFGLAEKMARGAQIGRGTPEYMPPEKLYDLRGGPIDRADSWSLGCTFAELRLGYPVMIGTRTIWESHKLPGETIAHLKTMREEAYQQLLHREGRQAAELFRALTKLHPGDRLSTTQALKHPYFAACYS
ncbi:serine/threonine-protein kinase [Endozoicomonas acroporae]|uniref:serine/threonine-protein kinase n=1 Tax=Endozoicomonas acroporae TaxID=1701104 RepID=UPI000C777982|nr:serine/threonine-protein kinase [Endozoicomonas acroporae]